MSRPALGCALIAGFIAAFGVADHRVGLAVTVVLLLVLAAGAIGAQGSRSAATLALATLLAVQPAVRDAGWVVVLTVGAALAAGAAAPAPARTWRSLASTALAPLRLVAGGALVARSVGRLVPAAPGRNVAAISRGIAVAFVLTGSFGLLFASADSAFAELAGAALVIDADPGDLAWRAILGLTVAAAAGALARTSRPAGQEGRPPGWAPGRTELRIALGALVTLFAVFVAVQVRVLFGGAAYVEATTGLGYGEYARQGFVQLLLVAALTLAVIAVSARQGDRVSRVFLGLLCMLTLVVLVSAHHRLTLVETAYGFTRVRYGGHAIVFWLAAVFLIVLAAGAQRRIARLAPRAAMLVTLGGVLAFSLSNPDDQIARRAVERFQETGLIDASYLAGLSADAVPALERLPVEERRRILGPIRARLARPDGVAGFNYARARSR